MMRGRAMSPAGRFGPVLALVVLVGDAVAGTAWPSEGAEPAGSSRRPPVPRGSAGGAAAAGDYSEDAGSSGHFHQASRRVVVSARNLRQICNADDSPGVCRRFCAVRDQSSFRGVDLCSLEDPGLAAAALAADPAAITSLVRMVEDAARGTATAAVATPGRAPQPTLLESLRRHPLPNYSPSASKVSAGSSKIERRRRPQAGYSKRLADACALRPNSVTTGFPTSALWAPATG
jgi:hypothetical protein